MMRITTLSSFDLSVANLQRRQQALSEAQIQLTSGKRVQKPSDDPAAAAQVERSLSTMTHTDAQTRALNSARTSMQLTESALGEAGNILSQARDLVVSAGNGTYTDAERRTVADSLRGLRNDLLAVANRGDGSGRYLFGGQGSDGQPMLDAPGGVTYNGINGAMQASTDEAMPLSFDGGAVWLKAPDPNNPGAAVSVFDALDKVINELSVTGRSGPQVAQTVSTGLAQIDASTANLSSWRSAAGELLNRAEDVGNRLSQTKLDAQNKRSGAEDLDMVQAVSDFQAKNTGYDAALKTYSLVQRMSLFDYVK